MQDGSTWRAGSTAFAEGRMQVAADPPCLHRSPHACPASAHGQVVHLPTVHLHWMLMSVWWGRGPCGDRSRLKHRRTGAVVAFVDPIRKRMSPLSAIEINEACPSRPVVSWRNFLKLTPAMKVEGAVDPRKGGSSHRHTDGQKMMSLGGRDANAENRAGAIGA